MLHHILYDIIIIIIIIIISVDIVIKNKKYHLLTGCINYGHMN